jgi:hypothetical protein
VNIGTSLPRGKGNLPDWVEKLSPWKIVALSLGNNIESI